MKLTNRRAGWITEGKFITILPANKPVDARCMLAYYGLKAGDRYFAECQRATRHTRVVLMKPTCTFVVVPMTPLVTEVSS